ncbi:2-oxoglutarate dehydrogenase E1 subunit family protein, partial [Agromyces sp. CCNWLW208]|uniref:2-oxoglutarate dehydrogenase E1 subunit family protein n=1 Tax=Agromyces sp. CCNWLW208 TaxID=3125790 RepID=UPI003014738C
MYERFLADPDSVDDTWRPVLEQYRKVKANGQQAAPAATPTMPDEAALYQAAGEQADAPAAPQAPAAEAPAAPAAPEAPAAEAPAAASYWTAERMRSAIPA